MKKYISSCKFAIWMGLRIESWTVLIAVILPIYFMAFGVTETLEKALLRFPFYLIGMSCFYLVIQGAVNVFTYMPLQITCGATRKQTVVALAVTNVVPMVINIVLITVFYAIVPPLLGHQIDILYYIRQFFNFYLFCIGLAMFIEPLVLKFGKAGYYSLILIIYAVMGFAVAIGRLDPFVNVLDFILYNPLTTVLAMLWAFLATYVMILTTKSYEVRV